MPKLDCTPAHPEDFRAFGPDAFEAVRDILAAEQQDAKARGLYMFVSRSTVLGRMKQLKDRAYREYRTQLKKACSDPYAYLGSPRQPGDIF